MRWHAKPNNEQVFSFIDSGLRHRFRAKGPGRTLGKIPKASIVQIQSLPIVDDPKSKVIPAAVAAVATFAFFVESESDSLRSSLELFDPLSASLSLASALEPSRLGDATTSKGPWCIDESTSAAFCDAESVAFRWISPLETCVVLWAIGKQKSASSESKRATTKGSKSVKR
jgi:hypothetical protein